MSAKPRPPVVVTGPIADYLLRMQVRGCSHETLRVVRSTLLRLEIWAAPRPLLTLTHADLYRWQVERSGQVEADTLRSQLGSLIGFYRWALREDLIERDPTARLDLPKKPYRLPRPIAEERLQRAVDAADATDQPYTALILLLGALAGLRACEVASLSWQDVDLDAATLRVIGKGDRERVLPLAPVLVERLTALPGPRRGSVIRRLDGGAGPNRACRVSQIANRHLRALGIADTFHATRHRFGTQVYRVSRDMRVTQQALGHVSPANTAKYTLVDGDDVRAAVLAAAGGQDRS